MPEQVRVAIDATCLLDDLTGVGRFTTELLTRLAPRIDFIAYGLTRIHLEELRARVPEPVRCITRPIPQRSVLRMWRRVPFPRIESWTGPVDVVHGPNFIVPPARRATELMTIHDLTVLRFPELCDEETQRYPSLIEAAIGRGAHVHTVSDFVRHEVLDAFALPEDRVHVIRNGTSIGPAGSAARGHALAGGLQYILAVGTIEPRKGYDLLVRAFDRLAGDHPSLRLVIAGKPGWGAASFDQAVSDARHRERIVRLGFVSDLDRADLLAGCAVLAFPSVYEGFGLPILEAMAAGVPVVTVPTGAIPEVAGDAALIVPRTVDALAEGLDHVLVDGEAARRLRHRGAQRASAYTWERCADDFERLYRALAASSTST